MRIFNRRSNNGTTVLESNALMQSGWGAITIGTAANVATTSVTFPIAYQNIPIITMNFAGDTGAGVAVALGNGGNIAEGQVTHKHYGDSTTGFTVYFNSPTGAWASGCVLYFTWIAVGV